MLPLLLLLSPILPFLPSAAAHGYLTKVVIDGKTYTGNVPSDFPDVQPIDSPIRQIADIGPVKGANNPSLTCGLSAQLATTVAPANPGSVIQLYWGDRQQNWPHNTGPLMTYMAACDTSTCDKFNGSTAKWFKIDQLGRKPDGSAWYLQDVMNGQPVTVTLPTQVAPGGYLLRHEIIALHLAVTLGGAEFYPSCTQILVGGSQTGTPNQTVSFPGAYNDNDPGIDDPNVYDNTAAYVFPGPPVSNLASPSSGTGSDVGPNSPATTGSGTTEGNKPASTSGSGSAPNAQPTSSSSKAICTLSKHGTPLTQRATGAARHKRRAGFRRAIRDAFRNS